MSEQIPRPQFEMPTQESLEDEVSLEVVNPANRELLMQIRERVDGVSEEYTEKLQKEVEQYATNPGRRAYLAKEAGAVIGYVEVTTDPEDLPKDLLVESNSDLSRLPSEFAHLARIGVIKDAESRGIGTKLLVQAEEWVRSTRTKRGIWLDYLSEKDNLRHFYEKNGYESITVFMDSSKGKMRRVATKTLD